LILPTGGCRENHDINDALIFYRRFALINVNTGRRHSLGFRYNVMDIGIVLNVSSERWNNELPVPRIVSAILKQIPPMIGFDFLFSYRISLSEYDDSATRR